MKSDDTSPPSSTLGDESVFATRWTLIDVARGAGSDAEVRRALDLVIHRYRPLILGFIRKNGVNPDDCEDLCHDYLFLSFQERVLRSADRSKGRFRTFLFHTLRAFIASHWRRANAEKRGGGRVVSLEAAFPDGDWGNHVEDPASLNELEFEIELELCKHFDVLKALRIQYEARKEQDVFDALKPHILETSPGLYETLSHQLGREPAAVRKSLSRLRERYVEAMLERIRHEACGADDNPKSELKEILKLIIVGTNRCAAERKQ